MIETMQLGMGKSVVSCCCNSSLVYMSQAASQAVHFSLGMARTMVVFFFLFFFVLTDCISGDWSFQLSMMSRC